MQFQHRSAPLHLPEPCCQGKAVFESHPTACSDAGARIVLKSRFEHEVDRINVYQDRFLVANTAHTLMLGDMETCCLSEVSWETTGTEKYHFDNPQVCHDAVMYLFSCEDMRFSKSGRRQNFVNLRMQHASKHCLEAGMHLILRTTS